MRIAARGDCARRGTARASVLARPARLGHRGGVRAASAGTGPSRWARQAAALLAQVRDDALRDDLRQRFDERAAICEIDGELSRTEAERIAFESLVRTLERSRGRE